MPHPEVELTFTTPFELLAATILAAQATDKKVNTLTPALFKKYPTIPDMAGATAEDIDSFVNHVLALPRAPIMDNPVFAVAV